MAEKRLPDEITDLLKAGNIAKAKKLFSGCDPNATAYFRSNIFTLTPMPKEFAIWAKEQGEVIHIAGRIEDELMRNGGMNWDDDYTR